MTLNVKAAVTICVGCIGSMSWFVQSTNVRQVSRAAPLVEAAAPLDVALGLTLPVAERSAEWSTPPELVAWRETVAQRFECANPIDEQRCRNQDVAPSLAALDWTDETGGELEPITLPPVAGQWSQATIAVAVLPPTDPDAANELPIGAAGTAPPVDVVPAGGTPVAATAPESGLPEAEFKDYRVVRGDTLTRIARREYGAHDHALLDVLMQQNPQVAARQGHVLAGEKLCIPDRATARRMAAEIAERELGVAASERWYVIKPNDSLSSIARRELSDANRWREILNLNRGLNKDKIFPGTRIKLPPVVRVAQG